MASSAYSDLELKYARPIAAALAGDRDFRKWLLEGTSFADVAAEARHDADLQRRLRVRPTMINPYWFNYWCGKDRSCACRVGTAIETDILMIFEASDARKFAVHVEVKRPNERLGLGQAEPYPRRAACWADQQTRPKRIPAHSDFVTVLACGRNLADDPQIRHFGRVAFHHEIAERLAVYPEPCYRVRRL